MDQVSTCIKNKETREYILNDNATAKKLVKAAKAEDLKICQNFNDSFTLTFSTGSYVKTVLPLLKFWKNNKKIRKADTAGLNVIIESVETKTDKAETPVEHIVRLLVEN